MLLLTYDIWHMTQRGWWVLCSNFRSKALLLLEEWWFKDFESFIQLYLWYGLLQYFNHEGVAKITVWLKRLNLFNYIISSLCIHAASIFKFIAIVLFFDFRCLTYVVEFTHSLDWMIYRRWNFRENIIQFCTNNFTFNINT